MNYRKFGTTELMVSEIGFGAWAIGGNSVVGHTPIGWGPSNDDESYDAIKASLDEGVNFFDTADFYGLGHSEKLLGSALHNMHDVIVATKVGHRVIDDRIQLDYSKDYILEACNKSLERLKRNHIDYYQLHSARMEHFEKETCIEAMEQLQREGKIRYWGLSLNTFKPTTEADYLIKNKKGDGFQLVFNLINQLAFPIINEATPNGYGIIARMPLQFGLLTGRIENEKKFSTDDHRNFRLNYEIISKTNKILETKVWNLCDKYSISKVSLALSFIISLNTVHTVIPGIRTKQQARENTSGIVRLDDEDLNFLLTLYQTDWKEIVQLMEERG